MASIQGCLEPAAVDIGERASEEEQLLLEAAINHIRPKYGSSAADSLGNWSVACTGNCRRMATPEESLARLVLRLCVGNKSAACGEGKDASGSEPGVNMRCNMLRRAGMALWFFFYLLAR